MLDLRFEADLQLDLGGGGLECAVHTCAFGDNRAWGEFSWARVTHTCVPLEPTRGILRALCMRVRSEATGGEGIMVGSCYTHMCYT